MFLAPRSPEQLQPPYEDRMQLGPAADVWALGVLMCQLAACDAYAPYGRDKGVADVVALVLRAKQAPKVPPTPIAPPLQALISSCLDLDPAKRPTAAHVLTASLMQQA